MNRQSLNLTSLLVFALVLSACAADGVVAQSDKGGAGQSAAEVPHSFAQIEVPAKGKSDKGRKANDIAEAKSAEQWNARQIKHNGVCLCVLVRESAEPSQIPFTLILENRGATDFMLVENRYLPLGKMMLADQNDHNMPYSIQRT